MPVLELTRCRACQHEWNAFFPQGKESDNAIQCPKCLQFTGVAK